MNGIVITLRGFIRKGDGAKILENWCLLGGSRPVNQDDGSIGQSLRCFVLARAGHDAVESLAGAGPISDRIVMAGVFMPKGGPSTARSLM